MKKNSLLEEFSASIRFRRPLEIGKRVVRRFARGNTALQLKGDVVTKEQLEDELRFIGKNL